MMTSSNTNPTVPIYIQTNMTARIRVVGAPIIVGKLVMQAVMIPTSTTQ